MPFDADAFMTATVDQPLQTERVLCPVGEYRCFVDDFDSTAFESFEFTYKKGPNAGQQGSFTKATFPIVVDSDSARAALQTDKVRVYYECRLDFKDDGSMDFGVNRNIDLGKLRHAVGQNQAGPWNVQQLRGAGPFMAKVEHHEQKYNGKSWKTAVITRMSPIR